MAGCVRLQSSRLVVGSQNMPRPLLHEGWHSSCQQQRAGKDTQLLLALKTLSRGTAHNLLLDLLQPSAAANTADSPSAVAAVALTAVAVANAAG